MRRVQAIAQPVELIRAGSKHDEATLTVYVLSRALARQAALSVQRAHWVREQPMRSVVIGDV